MKAKTIKRMITKKMNAWWESIDDEALRAQVKKNTIVTGGCIASMLLKEPVNDFDIYFRDSTTAEAVAKYYVSKFNAAKGYNLEVDNGEGRIRIVKHVGGRGATAGEPTTLTDAGEIEDTHEDMQDAPSPIRFSLSCASTANQTTSTRTTTSSTAPTIGRVGRAI